MSLLDDPIAQVLLADADVSACAVVAEVRSAALCTSRASCPSERCRATEFAMSHAIIDTMINPGTMHMAAKLFPRNLTLLMVSPLI